MKPQANMDLAGVVLRNDLLAWAEKAGAQFHRVGSEWRSCCPIHHGDNKSSFAVYTENGKQKWTCFTQCGSGDILDFVQKWQGCDLQTAYRILGGEESPDPLAVARAAQEMAARATAQMQAEIERAQRVLEELRQTQSWLTYHANLLADERARDLWRKRGIRDDWQDFWQLGYCPDFTVSADGQPHHTPTLTIPVMNEKVELVNVRHRLLSPPNPKDKYRPERPGLQAAPYLAYPARGYDVDPIIVVEGEIKSMVTFLTLYDRREIQVIGIPGKSAWRSVSERLKGHDVIIVFDPDAEQEAQEAARQVGGRYITFPMKIDDAINAGALDRAGIYRLLRMGRKV